MSVINYKENVKLKDIRIAESNKNKDTNTWDCEVSYLNGPLLVSTPRLKIQDGFLVFNGKHKKKFLDFLENLENSLVETLYEDSLIVFKGKKFSQQRLKESLEPSIDIEHSDILLKTVVSDNVKCFDLFGDSIEYEKISKDVSAVLQIDKIIFNKDLYRINYKITHLKMTKPEKIDEINFEPLKIEINHIEESETSCNFFD